MLLGGSNRLEKNINNIVLDFAALLSIFDRISEKHGGNQNNRDNDFVERCFGKV